MSQGETNTACRPEVLAALRRHLPSIDTTDGLVRCVASVALQDRPAFDPQDCLNQINAIAESIASRVHSDSPQARLAHAHDVLFDELGFAGDTEQYDDPRNSYLPEVLERRKGLPITLTLVYKAVLERVGLSVAGVNAPGHFMAAVGSQDPGQESGEMIVDVFAGGRALTDSQAIERVGEVLGRPAPHDRSMLTHATHTQWLLRVIQNLRASFARRDDSTRYTAMNELRALAMRELNF
ncbi:MAG: transglutaminase family protein [Phycisphaeraceae bacterium]